MMNSKDKKPPYNLDALKQFKHCPEHHVYHEWYWNERAGGPPGYLANLLLGYNQISDHFGKPLVVFDSYKGKTPKPAVPSTTNFKGFIKSIFGFFPSGMEYYQAHLSRYNNRVYSDTKRFLLNVDCMMPEENLVNRINWDHVQSVHVHTVAEAVKIKNYLLKNYYDDIKLILTCHTPESVVSEQYGVYVGMGLDKKRAKELANLWEGIEKKAFQVADIVIFPSKEAMEPMQKAIPQFDSFMRKKDVRFMATGARQLRSKLTRREAKEKYNVAGKKVVGFIGRHNCVKGYDLLKEAAQIVLSQRDDIVFLIGGSQGTEFQPLNDHNWIEAGWVQPADLFQALDLFVLPNRQTYYDLVLLEVLSTGTPVVATATGGNKSVKREADEIILCDTTAKSIANAILSFFEYDQKTRDHMGNQLLNIYQQKFTEKAMAKRYMDLIAQIYEDYDLFATFDHKHVKNDKEEDEV